MTSFSVCEMKYKKGEERQLLFIHEGIEKKNYKRFVELQCIDLVIKSTVGKFLNT